MTCNGCGTFAADNAPFCSSCGRKLRHEATVQRPRRYRQVDRIVDNVTAAGRSAVASPIGREVTAVGERSARLLGAALKTPLGGKMAKGAALGAVIAVPIPLVGWLTGAAVGAGIAAFNHLTKD